MNAQIQKSDIANDMEQERLDLLKIAESQIPKDILEILKISEKLSPPKNDYEVNISSFGTSNAYGLSDK